MDHCTYNLVWFHFNLYSNDVYIGKLKTNANQNKSQPHHCAVAAQQQPIIKTSSQSVLRAIETGFCLSSTILDFSFCFLFFFFSILLCFSYIFVSFTLQKTQSKQSVPLTPETLIEEQAQQQSSSSSRIIQQHKRQRPRHLRCPKDVLHHRVCSPLAKFVSARLVTSIFTLKIKMSQNEFPVVLFLFAFCWVILAH